MIKFQICLKQNDLEDNDKIKKKSYVTVSINNRKASASDKITNKIVKLINIYFPNLLLSIFNKCLKAGIFPSAWKNADLKLLKKPNKDTMEVTRDRSISLSVELLWKNL